MALDEKLLEILACPKCKGDLEYKCTEEEESLICQKCGLIYPVRDGIPVMFIEETKKF